MDTCVCNVSRHCFIPRFILKMINDLYLCNQPRSLIKWAAGMRKYTKNVVKIREELELERYSLNIL